MNLDSLQSKLVAAARAHPPSDAVPYGFERRILNHLKTLGKPDYWAPWAQALWRAAAPCVGVAVLLAAWSLLSAGNSPPTSPDISQQFENTVLAAATGDQPSVDQIR